MAVDLTSNRFDPGWGTAVFLSFAFVYLFFTLFLFPATPIFFENDHFIQMYDSVRMIEGEVLYKDFFQFTFPGTEVWYLILFTIFGERIWLLNATIVLLGLSIAATMLAISRRLMSGVYVYIAPSIFLFFGFRWYGMDGGHRLFSCLFATLAMLVVLDKTTRGRLAAAGAFSALTAFFTQNRGVGIVAAIAIFLVCEFIWFKKGERVGDLVTSLATFGGSFAVTLLMLIGYFLITAGVGTFIESTLLFASSYNADPLNNSNLYFHFWYSLFTGTFNRSSVLIDLFYYLLVPAVYILPVIFYFIKKPVATELWRKVMLLCVSGLLLFLVTTGLNSVRLYHVAMPGIVLIVLWAYRSSLKSIALACTGVIVAASLALCVWTQVKPHPDVTELPTGRVVFTSDAAGEKYRWINNNTEPGDLVFEPYRTVVNFPLMVRNPTSFAMLRSNDYTPAEHVSTVIRQLEAQPPRLILWDGKWSLPPGMRPANDHLGPLYAYLTDNYRLRETLTPLYEFNVEVWERVPE